jgi:hypothetical protein
MGRTARSTAAELSDAACLTSPDVTGITPGDPFWRRCPSCSRMVGSFSNLIRRSGMTNEDLLCSIRCTSGRSAREASGIIRSLLLAPCWRGAVLALIGARRRARSTAWTALPRCPRPGPTTAADMHVLPRSDICYRPCEILTFPAGIARKVGRPCAARAGLVGWPRRKEDIMPGEQRLKVREPGMACRHVARQAITRAARSQLRFRSGPWPRSRYRRSPGGSPRRPTAASHL